MTLIHSFLAILSPLATLGWHPTTEFKKCVFLIRFFFKVFIWEIINGGGYPLRDEKKTKDPGNERIRNRQKNPENLNS